MYVPMLGGNREIGRSEETLGWPGGLSNARVPRFHRLDYARHEPTNKHVYSWAPGFEIAFVPRGMRTRGSRAVTARACHSLSRQSISFNSAFRARSDRNENISCPGSRGTERTKERKEKKKRESRAYVFFFFFSRLSRRNVIVQLQVKKRKKEKRKKEET